MVDYIVKKISEIEIKHELFDKVLDKGLDTVKSVFNFTKESSGGSDIKQ